MSVASAGCEIGVAPQVGLDGVEFESGGAPQGKVGVHAIAQHGDTSGHGMAISPSNPTSTLAYTVVVSMEAWRSRAPIAGNEAPSRSKLVAAEWRSKCAPSVGALMPVR